MKSTVYVDPEGKASSNVFKTIQEALDDVKPNTIVKITSGNYTESI